MTNLAEQLADWTEPGAHPVVPGVHRIPLPLPPRALRAVNVYVLDDPAGPILVDSGWAGADGGRALAEGLRQLGAGVRDVARVVVTHAHHDHYTQALVLRESHGVSVELGRGERFSVAAMTRRGDGAPVPHVELLHRAGAADLAARMALLIKEGDESDDAPWGEPDRWLDDGDTVAVAARPLEVRATPGHTRGHVVLRDVRGGLLFSGDHVLPHITPSIGYERAPEPAPLRSYLASLRLVRDLPEAFLLPAHGRVTSSVHTRVDELLEHHERRLAAAFDQVRGGAGTAFEVAAALPWTRRNRRIDQMETEHAALAVLEIAAHLDVLVKNGVLVTDETEGVCYYATY